MAWLDKLLHKQRNVHRVWGRDQDQAQDRAGERQTPEKSRPCIDTDVLTKARCSEDNKHAGDEKGLLVKNWFSVLIIILQTFSHVPDKLWLYTFGLISLH